MTVNAASDHGRQKGRVRARAPIRDLTLADFTLLVIGAVIGADIYVVAALGAAQLGPAQLVAWLVAGVLAAVIGLAFVQCAAICPQVGGSYAYAHRAFGSFVGFMTGWALYVGEWIALPVFPVAFTNYLKFFIPDLDPTGVFVVRGLLISAVTLSNLVGARSGARVNDALTIAKLVPLAALVVGGVAFVLLRPSLAIQHLVPFVPLGWGGLGASILVVFWAYAGFELAVLPAGEVKMPRSTLPHGLVLGMLTATVFYLLVASAVVIALPWEVVANSSRSLADALDAILGSLQVTAVVGGAIMSVGALISIAGVYEAFTLGVARLSYALARDRLFQRAFGRLHSRFGTPYFGLGFQALTALILANLVDLTQLISASVLFLGVCYALTALAALRLIERSPEKALHVPRVRELLILAAVSGVYLAVQAPLPLILIGIAVMAAGVAIYVLRRGVWSTARDFEVEVQHEERQLDKFLTACQEWLLRFARRDIEP